MRYLPPKFGHLAVAVGLVVVQSLAAVPNRPAPMTDNPREDFFRPIDPVAERKLRAAFKNTKWAQDVENAAFKFNVTGETNGQFSIAASELSFQSDGFVSLRIVASAQWITADDSKFGTMISEPYPTGILIFDRPIGNMRDIAAAKLREIRTTNFSLNLRKGAP